MCVIVAYLSHLGLCIRPILLITSHLSWLLIFLLFRKNKQQNIYAATGIRTQDSQDFYKIIYYNF